MPRRGYRTAEQKAYDEIKSIVDRVLTHFERSPASLDWVMFIVGSLGTMMITANEASKAARNEENVVTVTDVVVEAGKRGLLGPLSLLWPADKKIPLPGAQATLSAALCATISAVALARLMAPIMGSTGGDPSKILSSLTGMVK